MASGPCENGAGESRIRTTCLHGRLGSALKAIALLPELLRSDKEALELHYLGGKGNRRAPRTWLRPLLVAHNYLSVSAFAFFREKELASWPPPPLFQQNQATEEGMNPSTTHDKAEIGSPEATVFSRSLACTTMRTVPA